MSRYYQTNSVPDFVPITIEEEVTLFEKYYASDDLEARDKIITLYLKLVIKIALGCASGRLEEDDAISAGNCALMDVLRTKAFKPTLGFRFGSFLRPYIKGYISRALVARNAIGGMLVGEKELAALLNNPAKMDAWSNVVAEGEPGDSLSTEERDTVRTRVLEVAKTMTESQQAYLHHYYIEGITNRAEIGRLMGMSREATRKIEKVVLTKLRFALKDFEA